MNGVNKTIDSDQAKMASLTAREREVIALIAEGLKNKQVAERLFISETTVTTPPKLDILKVRRFRSSRISDLRLCPQPGRDTTITRLSFTGYIVNRT